MSQADPNSVSERHPSLSAGVYVGLVHGRPTYSDSSGITVTFEEIARHRGCPVASIPDASIHMSLRADDPRRYVDGFHRAY